MYRLTLNMFYVVSKVSFLYVRRLFWNGPTIQYLKKKKKKEKEL